MIKSYIINGIAFIERSFSSILGKIQSDVSIQLNLSDQWKDSR